MLTQSVHQVCKQRENIRTLACHERQALEAGDLRPDSRVKADGQHIERMGVVAADEVKARFLRVEQALDLKKRLCLGKNLDGVVAGAAWKMRHRRV